jgi:hypothetical protein
MWFVSEEDEQRFAHALLASLLAHVLVLGYVRGVEPLRKAGVGGALNVSFRSTAATGQILAQARLPTPVAATAALVQAQVTAPRLATPKPQPQPAPTVERKGSPESAAAALHSADLVSFISTNMTLLPGDVILTGTPSGVGPIESGDRLEVRIQGLAPLVNTVK